MPPRNTDVAVDPMFLERWSPRAFDGSDMPESDLITILEAGRWAPSAFNYQPWRFVYSLRDDAYWADFLSCLIPFNAIWAKNASALLFILSDRMMIGKNGPSESYSHSFDAGSAWGYMALQAMRLGYFAHGMTGIEVDRAADKLGVPPEFRVEAAVAIGKLGKAEILPEGLREREGPSDRKPLNELSFRGCFRS